MNGLPMDPIMLYSVLNTKLHDQYSSLAQLCDAMDVDQKEIEDKLKAVGFEYDSEKNQFK